MRVAAVRPEPLMTAHILAQLLDSTLLDATAVARFQAVLQREGLDLPTMIRQGTPTPLRWFREVYPGLDADQAARLGCAAGEQARLTSYSPLSLPLVSATTLDDALRLLAYLPLISNSLAARFIEQPEAVTVVLTTMSGDPLLDRFPLFYLAAALGRLLQLLSAEPVTLDIHIAWPRPAGLALEPGGNPATVHFDAPRHCIVVPRSTLAARCRFPDPIAYQTEIAGLEQRMAALGSGDDLVERLRRLLEARPGLLAIDEAAQQLHLSVSTLKRRLAEAGTQYRELRDAMQQERARQLLGDGSLSLEAIAGALGYSDLANFSHAFKRWTGEPPGLFRRRRAGSSAAL